VNSPDRAPQFSNQFTNIDLGSDQLKPSIGAENKTERFSQQLPIVDDEYLDSGGLDRPPRHRPSTGRYWYRLGRRRAG
jgi:hypothetical protein